MLLIQSIGNDPGMDIVRSVWSEENLFRTPRCMMLNVLKRKMQEERRNLRYFLYTDSSSLFCYQLHTLASKIPRNIGTSILRTSWNAAVYTALVEDAKLMKVLRKGGYFEETEKNLRAHDGLWFTNELFTVLRGRT